MRTKPLKKNKSSSSSFLMSFLVYSNPLRGSLHLFSPHRWGTTVFVSMALFSSLQRSDPNCLLNSWPALGHPLRTRCWHVFPCVLSLSFARFFPVRPGGTPQTGRLLSACDRKGSTGWQNWELWSMQRSQKYPVPARCRTVACTQRQGGSTAKEKKQRRVFKIHFSTIFLYIEGEKTKLNQENKPKLVKKKVQNILVHITVPFRECLLFLLYESILNIVCKLVWKFWEEEHSRRNFPLTSKL